ncbi:MAG: hypothetical protein WCT16_01570 [Candidatus Buchananbacteria bacterium]
MLLDILIIIYAISGTFSLVFITLGFSLLFSKEKKTGMASIAIGLALLLCAGFSSYQARKITMTKSNIQQDQEIAAVQEYETEGKIRGDRAWWISLPAQQLEKKCQAIAEKIGKSWQEIVKLLSSKNAIIIFDPQLEKAP